MNPELRRAPRAASADVVAVEMAGTPASPRTGMSAWDGASSRRPGACLVAAVRLGFRLSAVGSGARLRLVLLGIGGAIASLAAMASLAVPAILQARSDRAAAQTLVPAPRGGPGLLATVIDDSIDGRQLRRVAINANGSTLLPPGVTHIPAVGEKVWSQALADLAARDPIVTRRFPQTEVGTIREEGLETPDQLMVYVGVDPSNFRSVVGPSSFGELGETSTVSGRVDSRTAWSVAIGTLIFLSLPAAGFLATAARLSARQRALRLARLRVMGLSPGMTRFVNGIEVAVVGVIGAAVGVGAWCLFNPRLAHAGIAGVRWFPADAAFSITKAIGVVFGLGLLATVISTLGANRSITDPLRASRREVASPGSAWRLAVLFVGLLLLGASIAMRLQFRQYRLGSILLGGLLMMIGVVLAGPVIARSCGAVVGLWRRPSALMAGRRLAHDPTVTDRLLTGLVLSTFAITAASGAVSAFQSVGRSVDQFEISSGIVTELIRTSPLDRSQILQLPGVVDATAGGGLALPGFTIDPVDPAKITVNGKSTEWAVQLKATGYSRERFATSMNALDPASSFRMSDDLSGGELSRLVAALVTMAGLTALAIGGISLAVATIDRTIERRRQQVALVAIGTPVGILRRSQALASLAPMLLATTLALLAGTATGWSYFDYGKQSGTFSWSLSATAALICLAVATTAALASCAVIAPRPTAELLRSE